MKNKLLDLVHFVFLIALYCILKTFSYLDESFAIISFSYIYFLKIVDQFTVIMAMKGWGRLP